MRQHKPTSKMGEQHIKPFKPNHKAKILEGLERLKIGGNFEQISSVCGLKDVQVWKRLSEMERDGTIFNTGLTRKLKSGVSGIVWQMVGLKPTVVTSNPKTTKEKNNYNTLRQLSLL